ncbi:(deoxy)nucleoside triphosphate pyrophosphohydrolase [Paenalkalicoccus suaedae]|uniref:8-oxo-dGTP diphosphatase n=1 Tax=Paenalkalicoccus suaedae TaxID=2592382 RepID=A0A859FJQ5_9BACI|nr:(deoxy)nucleoside triphosphate pyrophosphohydrolase [Paenalkalicoccus suaedae]QKS73037.1 (deoxy)nucleoside triphosphate pyrophosphohydrolase [Paenalkalicoccus suaedae]
MKKHVNVVAAVIENEQNEVLCALRSHEMSLPNVWEFAGGKVEQGEDLQAALEREIEEELGCLIQAGDVIHTNTHEYEKVIVTLHCLHATITKGEPTASEHAKLLWLPKRQLESLQWAPADVPAVESLVKAAVL